MAINLKEYVVVAFHTEAEAHSALNSTLQRFKKQVMHAYELSHVEKNIVFIHVENPQEKALVENFLLTQKGAQPKGCRCKI